MTDGLEQRIEAELTAARKRSEALRAELTKGYEGLPDRYDRFVALSARILASPRAGQMKKLAAAFDHARLTRTHDRAGYHGVVEFLYTSRFPANASVAAHMRPDAQFRNITFSFDVQLTPAFIRFQPHEEVSYPLQEVDIDALFAWVDNRIIDFVRTYTELETAQEYQQENLVTDPVLGLRFSRIHAVAEEQHNSHKVYFLTAESQAVFRKDPDAFVAAK